MLCNPETGVCEIPGIQHVSPEMVETANAKPIKIIYFTDPICSTCWGIEPQLRKLKLEYGDIVDIDYHMGGLLPDWNYNSGGISKPSDVAHHWDEVSAYYDMPIDGDVWLEDPLHSSYPPSIAFKAAQIQDKEMAILFLRKLRELLFLEKKNITKWEYVEQAATSAGLDSIKLKEDYEGRAKQLFEEDLALAGKSGVRGFPTLFFFDSNGNQVSIYGFKPYEQFEKAILKLFPAAKPKQAFTSLLSLLQHYTTVTTKEFAVIAGKSLEESYQLLSEFSSAGVIHKQTSKNGDLWISEK